MTLEQFKKATKEELKEYGKTLPIGETCDKEGRVIISNDAGYSWSESTWDDKGNRLTYKDNDGFWLESTYDDKGNRLTHENSAGSWHEHTYDENGNEIAYKTCKSFYGIKGKEVSKEEYEKFKKGDKNA